MAISTNDQVASRVRATAAEQQVTQTELSAALDKSKMWVSRRFNGRTPFSVDDLTNIAQVLNVPLAAFLSPSSPTARPVGDLPPVPAGRVLSVSGDNS